MLTRNRQAAVSSDDDSDIERRQRRRPNRNDQDSESDADDGRQSAAEMDVDEGSTADGLMAKRLVRYALACEYSRITIRRDGIREKGLRPASSPAQGGSLTLGSAGRQGPRL